MQVMTILVCLVIILSGVVGIFSPQTIWYLQEGWKFKDAEPSDAALIFYRIGGIIAIIGGIIFLVSSGSFFE